MHAERDIAHYLMHPASLITLVYFHIFSETASKTRGHSFSPDARPFPVKEETVER